MTTQEEERIKINSRSRGELHLDGAFNRAVHEAADRANALAKLCGRHQLTAGFHEETAKEAAKYTAVDPETGAETIETDKDFTVLGKALAAEYGWGKSPPRRFMRLALKRGRARWGRMIVPAYAELVSTGSPAGVHRIGGAMAAQIKQEIRDFTTPGNADRTIRQKGEDNPLVDTGQLGTAARYVITNRTGNGD